MAAETVSLNVLVGHSNVETANNVIQVLEFLSVVQPPDDNTLSSDQEMGRHWILQNCIEALRSIEQSNLG